MESFAYGSLLICNFIPSPLNFQRPNLISAEVPRLFLQRDFQLAGILNECNYRITAEMTVHINCIKDPQSIADQRTADCKRVKYIS
jgi:hypothetical protein